MIESGSSIQTFLTCPKLYWFKYVQLLSTRSYSSALGFGTFLHAMVESVNGGRSAGAEEELVRLLGSTAPECRDQIEADHRLASAFFGLWRSRWSGAHPHANDQFEFIASEKEWGFSVGSDTHVGKSDGVVRHKQSGAVFLYELKTAADRARESYVHKLEIDRQVSSNILALKREGIEVQGVLYDVVWKPALRKLVGRKTKPDETNEEFSDRMVATVSAEPDNYFERTIVYRSDRLLADHERDLFTQFDMIARAHERGFARNTGSCDQWGRLCPFFSACLEGNEELQSLYAQKDRKLPELSKEIQCTSTVPPTSPTTTSKP